MKVLSIAQSIITILGSCFLLIWVSTEAAVSFCVGSMVIFFSVLAFRIGFGLIFKQKLIALAIGIIVIKYAILGIFIYVLVTKNWFDPLWFSLGVGSFTVAVVGYTVIEALKKEDKNVSI